MSVGDYYISRRKLSQVGKLWLLKSPQRADAGGGGKNLLGSVAREEGPGILESRHYPVPELLLEPKIITRAVMERLGKTEEQVELKIPIEAAKAKIRIERSQSLALGVGPFPSVPAEVGLNIDRSRIVSLDLSFDDAEVRYIPPGFIAQLHEQVDGAHSQVHASGLIDEGRVIWKILLAKSYSATFHSETKFDAKFEAKLDAFNQLPKVTGKVQYEVISERSLIATVTSDTPYLVGLRGRDWDDFDMT